MFYITSRCVLSPCISGDDKPIRQPSGIVPKHWGIVADAIKRRRYARPGCSGTLWWLPAGCLGTVSCCHWLDSQRYTSCVGSRDDVRVWFSGCSDCGCSIVSLVFHREGQVSAGNAILGYNYVRGLSCSLSLLSWRIVYLLIVSCVSTALYEADRAEENGARLQSVLD